MRFVVGFWDSLVSEFVVLFGHYIWGCTKYKKKFSAPLLDNVLYFNHIQIRLFSKLATFLKVYFGTHIFSSTCPKLARRFIQNV